MTDKSQYYEPAGPAKATQNGWVSLPIERPHQGQSQGIDVLAVVVVLVVLSSMFYFFICH